MDSQAAASAYRQATIENAPPIKIIRLMYEGAIKFLDRAMRCDPADSESQFLDWIERADAIVCELRLCLDHSHDEGISQSLERLYLFCESKLSEAQTERSLEPLQHARKILSILGEAWSEIELQAHEVA